MKPTQRPKLSLTVLILAWVAIPSSAGAGDAIAGEALAKRWCSACHDIGQGQTSSDGAPRFAWIARQPEKTRAMLKIWLADPHPPMPKLDLSRGEIDDLLSYIESLR